MAQGIILTAGDTSSYEKFQHGVKTKYEAILPTDITEDKNEFIVKKCKPLSSTCFHICLHALPIKLDTNIKNKIKKIIGFYNFSDSYSHITLAFSHQLCYLRGSYS